MFVLLICSASCAILPKGELEEEELFSIDSNAVMADEFLYVYEKNNFNNDSIYTEEDIEAYLDLFLNFKLKVAAAKSAGIDTSEAFITEFNSYKDQLIKPYLSESIEQEKLLTEAYERMKYEIDASHILVSVDENASPEDTAVAYEKMEEIRQRALSGEDFGSLAEQFSGDPSAKTNKGRLGFFTAFQMVFAFEEAAYSTPVDSISYMVRSRFGYHILKIHEKRPYSGRVQVSHIMLRTDPTKEENPAVRNKIFEIHTQIVGGADWNEMCSRYSEDARSKNSGGSMQPFGLRQVGDEAFENAAFALESPGDISDPVKSRFGWHIIRLDEKQGLATFEEMKEDLEKRIARDDRILLSRKSLVSKLKRENNYQLTQTTFDVMLQQADSSILFGTFAFDSAIQFRNDTLFSLNERVFIAGEAIEYIEQNQKRTTGKSPSTSMTELIDAFTEESLLAYEEENLIESNREFRMLLREYYEGILLFEIMDQKVWGKAVRDTTGQRKFYSTHEQDYFWKKRLDAAIISSKDEELLEKVQAQIEHGTFKLMEMSIDVDLDNPIISNQSLDALSRLFRQHEECEIEIIVSDSLRDLEVYTKLRTHLRELGVPDEQVLVSKSDTSPDKLLLILNSRSKKSLEYLYNQETALNLQVLEGLFELGDNQILDSVSWETGIYEIVDGSNHALVVVENVLEPQRKELKDVKGLVISDYQNYLEEKWIEQLRARYAVDINRAVLERIKKLYRKKLDTAA